MQVCFPVQRVTTVVAVVRSLVYRETMSEEAVLGVLCTKYNLESFPAPHCGSMLNWTQKHKWNTTGAPYQHHHQYSRRTVHPH